MGFIYVFPSETSAQKMVPWKQIAGTDKITMLALGPFLMSPHTAYPSCSSTGFLMGVKGGPIDVAEISCSSTSRIRPERFGKWNSCYNSPHHHSNQEDSGLQQWSLASPLWPSAPDSIWKESSPGLIAPPPTFRVGFSLRETKWKYAPRSLF